jgi:YHS domain-containing protein
MRRSGFLGIFTLALISWSVLAPTTRAQPNVDDHGLALAGHDPVAYFVDGAPVEGRADLVAEHDGATYRFASEAHRETFLTDPERYVPRYGGWCAFAMARGERVEVDPRAFKIVDGRLYLNYSLRVGRKWEKDVEGYIARADEQWRILAAKDR